MDIKEAVEIATVMIALRYMGKGQKKREKLALQTLIDKVKEQEERIVELYHHELENHTLRKRIPKIDEGKI